MRTLMRYVGAIKGFAIRRPWTTGIIVLVIVGGFWYYSNSHKPAAIDFAVVERGTVSQVVSVTGKVKPAKEVQLSFEKGGRIAFVYHDVGARVSAGTPLVALDNRDVAAQLAQAEASVKVQEATLADLKNGPSIEDITVSEVAVTNANNDVVNDVKNAYVYSDDAIRNKVDQMFSNPRNSNPQLNIVISNSQLKSEIENQRPALELLLLSWNVSVADIADAQDLGPRINEAKKDLRTVQNYLDKMASAVNSLTANSGISQTTVDAYKAAVLTGRTNVTTALDSLTTSEEKLKTAQSSLALKKAGTSQDKIDAQAAQVSASQANVMNLNAQLAKTVIYSPISGIVTKQDAKAGEIAVAGANLVSVISDSKYEIEANIPEADIAKIKIGDEAQVTLDAYGNDVLFPATVAKIDPAETVVEGVSTYKTTLQFKKDDARIKSGMTANTDVSGEIHKETLFIPGRAIKNVGANKSVILIEGDTAREVSITTGLRGSNGDVEILSGLKESDKVKIN